MHSHSIVARVWLVTGVRVPCMGEDSVVAARHCFSAIPDSSEIETDIIDDDEVKKELQRKREKNYRRALTL